MKFTIPSSAFYARLTVANKVIASKNTMPILECFHLDIRNGHVSITASDGDKYFVTRVPLIDSDNNASFCVTAKLLIESIKELAEQPLTLIFNPETMELRGEHQTGNFSLIGQDASLYPQHQEMEEQHTSLSVKSDTLLKGINLCINATSTEELRMIMTCVYMDIHEEDITFAATDGRKLVRYINRETKPGINTGLILPKKVAAVLKSTLKTGEELTIKFDKEKAQITAENMEFYFRLVEGNYLNYNTVIPTNNPYCATVDRESLVGAIKRVSVFCNQSSGLTKMRLDNGTMQLTSQDSDYHTNAEENILCDYNDQPISIGFNCFYMMDIISVIDAEHISVQLADPSRPAAIVPVEQEENEEAIMLLMPMMLNE